MKFVIICVTLCAIFNVSLTFASEKNDVAYDKVIMCYFGSWSTYRWATGHFDVEDIDPFLCTHLVFGFAGLDPESYTIRALDPYNELDENWGKGAYLEKTVTLRIADNIARYIKINICYCIFAGFVCTCRRAGSRRIYRRS